MDYSTYTDYVNHFDDFVEFTEKSKNVGFVKRGIIDPNKKTQVFSDMVDEEMKKCVNIIRTYLNSKKCLNFIYWNPENPLKQKEKSSNIHLMIQEEMKTYSPRNKIFLTKLESKKDPKLECQMSAKLISISKFPEYSTSKKEVDLMIKASSLVEKGLSNHFPMVFVSVCCSRVQLDNKRLPKDIHTHFSSHFGYLEQLSNIVFEDNISDPSLSFTEKLKKYKEEYIRIRSSLEYENKTDFVDYLSTFEKYLEYKDQKKFNIFERKKLSITKKGVIDRAIKKTDDPVLTSLPIFDLYATTSSSKKMMKKKDSFPLLDVTSQIRARIVLMEPASSNLHHQLEFQAIEESFIINALLQVTVGLSILHQKLGYIHNDMRTENVLISYQIDPKTKVKSQRFMICGFGNAVKIPTDEKQEYEKDMELEETLRTPAEDFFFFLDSMIDVLQQNIFLAMDSVKKALFLVKYIKLSVRKIYDNIVTDMNSENIISLIMEHFMTSNSELFDESYVETGQVFSSMMKTAELKTFQLKSDRTTTSVPSFKSFDNRVSMQQLVDAFSE